MTRRLRVQGPLRYLALLIAAALVVLVVLWVVSAVRDAQPGVRDIGEMSATLSSIDGYDAKCDEKLFQTEQFSGGTVRNLFCYVKYHGKRLPPDGIVEVQLVDPADAMSDYVAAARVKATLRLDSVVGENWVIVGLARDDRFRHDLLTLDHTRLDPFGDYDLKRRRR